MVSIWAPNETSPGAPLLSDLVWTVAFTISFYWRAAVHLNDVRIRTETRTDAPVPGVI